MERPEKKKRNLLISDSISQDTVDDIITKVFEINDDDDLKESIYKDWVRDPIMLFINSCGGNVYSGLALFDVIKQSRTPVYTICIGSCMSMGLWVWLAGRKRLVGDNATLMFHDISTFSIGKTEAVKQDLKETLRLQDMFIKTVVETSTVREETLKDYITRKAEWFIPAAEAISMSLADGYYRTSDAEAGS